MRRLAALPVLAAVGLGLLLAAPATAQLVADRLVIDFEPGGTTRQDILLRNESQDKYYITVTPKEVIHPGDDDATEVPNSNPEALGLLVTPNRIVLDPGASRSIRVVSLNKNLPKDRIYRVLISPQVGELKTQAAGDGNRGIALKILTAYEALVIARPVRNAGGAVVTGQRNADGALVLKNTGPTNALLSEGKACEPKSADKAAAKCVDLPTHRIYAGNEWTVTLPQPDDTVTYLMETTGQTTPRQLQF